MSFVGTRAYSREGPCTGKDASHAAHTTLHLKWAPTATRAPDVCPAVPSQTGRLHAELSALDSSAVKSTFVGTTGLMFDTAHALHI